MKLAHKLTGLLVLGNCLVLSGYGLLARQREVDRFEGTMERDTFLAGSTLLATVESSWRSHGEGEALRLIAHASSRQKNMTFRWLSQREFLERRLDAYPQAAAIRTGERAFHRSEGTLHMFVPLVPPSGEPGVLEVTKDMAGDAAYVRSSTLLLVGATLASIGVSAVIAFLIGSALVGRPMEVLVKRVATVGAGKLSGRLELGRSDEIGILANALNQMSSDLQDASAKAEAEAAERRAALRQLRHAERLATVGRLAAGVAHELGTPLNVVLARAKLIERGLEDARIRKHTEIIRDQAQRMATIIRQLLDFARRGESERVLTEIGPVVAKVLEALGPLAAKKGVTLVFEALSDAWTQADPGQLQQVLTNLVMNAIQASPAKARVVVTLVAVSDTPPVEHGGPGADYWCIEVRDQGPGIPEDVREQIFEPFFTTKDVGEGTGLGLTVTHGIVAEHDGWITVDSEPGSGCAFKVFLPATPQPLEVVA